MNCSIDKVAMGAMGMKVFDKTEWVWQINGLLGLL